MLLCMRTTLVIPDAVYRELKQRAAEEGRTLSGLVTELLRRGLEAEPERGELSPLPTFDAGRPRVDLSDRDALFEALEAAPGAVRERGGHAEGEGNGGTRTDR